MQYMLLQCFSFQWQIAQNMMISFSFQCLLSRTALKSILTSQNFALVEVLKAFTVAVGHLFIHVFSFKYSHSAIC